MVKILLNCFFIMTILLFGILFGTFHSHQHIQGKESVSRSLHSLSYNEPIGGSKEFKEGHTKETSQTNHQSYERHDRERGSFNFFSELGRMIADVFQWTFHSFVSLVIGTVNDLLHE